MAVGMMLAPQYKSQPEMAEDVTFSLHREKNFLINCSTPEICCKFNLS